MYSSIIQGDTEKPGRKERVIYTVGLTQKLIDMKKWNKNQMKGYIVTFYYDYNKFSKLPPSYRIQQLTYFKNLILL